LYCRYTPALQQDKATVFAGTFGALAIMTGISVGIGQVFHVADESLSIFHGGVPWLGGRGTKTSPVDPYA
jgi:putative Ca2+/H+ antiporter (TMEM165/GDT1 family)